MSRVGTVITPHQGTIRTDLAHWLRTLPPTIAWETPRGGEIARQRNMGVAKGLAGDWVLFVDSDSVPRVEALPTLLSRDVDIISAVICQRTAPWHVCAMEGELTETSIRKVDLATLPREGIRTVTAVGAGFLLIRRRVFDQVPVPWFQCGQIRPDQLHEDAYFCLAAAKVGFPIYLDCEVRVGHDFGGGVVWPGRDGHPYLEWPNGISAPAAEPVTV